MICEVVGKPEHGRAVKWTNPSPSFSFNSKSLSRKRPSDTFFLDEARFSSAITSLEDGAAVKRKTSRAKPQVEVIESLTNIC
jgi:hypothetical protein